MKKSDIPDESFDVLKQAAGYCAIRLQQGEDPIEVTVELAVAAWLRGKKDERAISARALAILAALVDPKLTNAQEAATLMEEARDLLDE